MNAPEYTRKLRRVATFSWVGSLVVFLCLTWLHIIPFNEVLPFLALFIGTMPIIAFVMVNKAKCESCGGQMKISSGYPRIFYRCIRCGSEVDTVIFSDF